MKKYKITFIIYFLISFAVLSQNNISVSQIGFEWRKLENTDENSRFQFVLPRSHSVSAHVNTLWSYAVVLSSDEGFSDRIDSMFVQLDYINNMWMTFDGNLLDLKYHIYQIAEQENIGMIDINGDYPFPEIYPDSVSLFLLPGRNIESDNSRIIEIADSLKGNSTDMAITARNIATSVLIRTMPYGVADRDSVLNGTITFNWADGSMSSALETYNKRQATCAEIARLQVALCRAACIPARTYSGTTFHIWSEVWINGYGWQQMEQGFFPDRKPASLCRLSGNDDSAWFDWAPYSLSTFKKSGFIMDNTLPESYYENLRLVVAKPSKIQLPLNNYKGLIPIEENYSLYIFESGDNYEIRIVKNADYSIAHSSIIPVRNDYIDVLSFNLEEYGYSLDIMISGGWVILGIEKRPVTGIKKSESSETSLFQNFPNPFSGNTEISFELGKPANISMRIYDQLGKVIFDVIRDKHFTEGKHIIPLGVHNLSEGIYFYSLIQNNRSRLYRKMIIVN